MQLFVWLCIVHFGVEIEVTRAFNKISSDTKPVANVCDQSIIIAHSSSLFSYPEKLLASGSWVYGYSAYYRLMLFGAGVVLYLQVVTGYLVAHLIKHLL